MKEQLRQSLDDAIGIQKMTQTYRAVIRQLLQTHPETNDELTIVMISAHNGLGKILVALYQAIEIIQERIAIHGNGEGIEKKLLAQFKEEDDMDIVKEDPNAEKPEDEDEYEDYQYEDPNDD